ncbi:MAG: PepSY domain-containing protein [Cellulosilyticaceae bacterium]
MKEKVKSKLKGIKRTLIGLTIGMITLGIIGAIVIGTVSLGWIKEQVNYTEEHAKTIALESVPGEVLEIQKELDDFMLVYEVRIRDTNNRLQKVEVSAKYGTIKLDDESYYWMN